VRPFRRRQRLQEVGRPPDYRFSLANERTFLAWVRTALGLVVAGLAIIQLLPPFAIPGGRHALGLPLIALGAIVAFTSYQRWERNERAIRTGTGLPPSTLPLLVAGGIAFFAGAAIVLAVLSGR
jgi:putative membrane protein